MLPRNGKRRTVSDSFFLFHYFFIKCEADWEESERQSKEKAPDWTTHRIPSLCSLFVLFVTKNHPRENWKQGSEHLSFSFSLICLLRTAPLPSAFPAVGRQYKIPKSFLPPARKMVWRKQLWVNKQQEQKELRSLPWPPLSRQAICQSSLWLKQQQQE